MTLEAQKRGPRKIPARARVGQAINRDVIARSRKILIYRGDAATMKKKRKKKKKRAIAVRYLRFSNFVCAREPRDCATRV